MNWGAHEVDGRIAAKAAIKIRAALRQSIDAKRVYQLYKESDPAVTDNEAQDNARARAWAMLNMRINNNALITALQFLWAEAFILGEDSGREAIRLAREAKKDLEAGVDWGSWKAGDRAKALLIQPPGAFRRLLEKQGIAIKGLDKTGYDRVGTALARSIRLGLGDASAARQINEAIGSPARALTIAITETNRAVSMGAMKAYKDARLEKMEWAVSDPCPECAQNSGQVIDIGGTFNSGAQQPPAHAHCRCALLPVIPDYETNQAGVVDVAGSVPGATRTTSGDLLVDYQKAEWSKALKGDAAIAALARQRRKLREYQDNKTYNDAEWKQIENTEGLLWTTYDRQEIRGYTLYERDTTILFVADASATARLSVSTYQNALNKMQNSEFIPGLKTFISAKKLKEWRKDPNTTFGASTRGGRTADLPLLTINPEKTGSQNYNPRTKMKVNPEISQLEYTLAHEWGHMIEKWNRPTGATMPMNQWTDALLMNNIEIQRLIEKSYGDVWGGSLMSQYGNSDPAEAYAEAFAAWFLTPDKSQVNPLVKAFAERYGWK